jgi:uroporphyrin-III C-methyltransferase
MEAATRFRRLVRSLRRPRDAEEACYDAFFAATVDAAQLEARVPTADEEARLVGLTPQAVEAALGDGDRDRASAGGGDGDAARGAGTDAAPAGTDAAPAGTDAAPAGTDAAPAGTDAAPAGTDAAPADGNSAAGFVSLVGAGPGDAGLMTLRGRQRLLAARAVVYDRLAATALPCDLPDTVELHCVGKQAGRHPVPQEEINALLVRLARRGWRVVRLKGGDPFVFGRGGEEAEALVEAGIPFEIVPAVTAGVAVPAYAGIPITHRRESVRATFVTAHEAVKRRGPQVRWDLLAADPHATLVGYMGVTALPQVAERLITAGLDPATPAAMIESGTTARQRVVRDTIAGLAAAVTAAGLEPPGLFVIGPTVRHAEHLDWFASRPLHGERLVAVAPAGTLGSALELRGAEVVEVTLPIRPAARVVMGALPVSGCVVRSADEVDALDEEREGRGWGPDVVAWCLGAETARRAAARGWRHVVPVESPSALAARMIERRAHRDCESLSR